MMLLRESASKPRKAKQMSRVGRPATVSCVDRKKSKVNGYKKSVSSGGMVYIVQMPEDGVGGRGTMPAASDEGR